MFSEFQFLSPRCRSDTLCPQLQRSEGALTARILKWGFATGVYRKTLATNTRCDVFGDNVRSSSLAVVAQWLRGIGHAHRYV